MTAPTPLATITVTLSEYGDRYLLAVTDQAGEPLALTAIGKPTNLDSICEGVADTFHPDYGDAGAEIADSIRKTLGSLGQA